MLAFLYTMTFCIFMYSDLYPYVHWIVIRVLFEKDFGIDQQSVLENIVNIFCDIIIY